MKRPVKKAARELGSSAARPGFHLGDGLGGLKRADRSAEGRVSERQPEGPARSPERTAMPGGTAAASAGLRFSTILAELKRTYPDAHCELDFTSPFQLICATILSAQCTDVRVNMVTPALFAKYPDATALAAAKQEDVEEIIRSTGFFRNKARSLIGMAQAVVADHGGEIPSTMDALVKLPGVGRKTANVVLGNAFAMNEGVVVDTHVSRLSGLLGLTHQTDPLKIEQDLMALTPRDDWALLSHLLIFHGRRVCIARRPRCGECVVAEWCPGRRTDGQMDS